MSMSFLTGAFTWLLTGLTIVIGLPTLYLCIISLAAVLRAKKMRVQEGSISTEPAVPTTDFAILIPAHNEELLLGNLLESLRELHYPQTLFTVHVVVDNCTDGTAELARRFTGVHVHERVDHTKRGKGYALHWLVQQIEAAHLSCDAYVILDADSVIAPNFLRLIDCELVHGAQALQARYTVLNATESPGSALRWIALSLVNHVRPLGRTCLGGSSTLNGNGMCLSRDLLTRYPWRSFGLAEDYQYYLTIVEHGERVVYVPEAVVSSQMPKTFAQMRTQDIRWESSSGNQPSWRAALTLLKAGIRNRDGVRIEAVAELLTPPLSLLVCGCLMLLVLSPFIWLWTGFIISLLLVAGLMVYIGSAFYLLRPQRAVYMALLYAPGFIIWKLWVYFVLRRSKKHTGEWVRTSRA